VKVICENAQEGRIQSDTGTPSKLIYDIKPGLKYLFISDYTVTSSPKMGCGHPLHPETFRNGVLAELVRKMLDVSKGSTFDYVILFATSDGLEMLNNTYSNRKLSAFIFD
jgi:hypothetical protein